MKTLLLLPIIACCLFSFAQTYDFSKVSNSKFPESWDNNRDLRGKNGQVLAWAYIKTGRKYENRLCLTLVYGPDSTGNIEYFISQMFSSEKPFDKWSYAMVHYLPNKRDTTAKLQIGFFDTHIRRFTNKPNEKEIYDLLTKWNFSLFAKGSKTLEAGIDETLWLNSFGFPIDKKKLTTIYN
ncbi:MAG: hypothetical protein QM802_09190 [Agriterribacter sp.]